MGGIVFSHRPAALLDNPGPPHPSQMESRRGVNPGGSHASAIVSGGWEYDRRARPIRLEPLLSGQVTHPVTTTGVAKSVRARAEFVAAKTLAAPKISVRRKLHATRAAVKTARAVKTTSAKTIHTAVIHATAIHHATAHAPAIHARATHPGSRAANAGQHCEAPLLAIVEALVERVGRLGEPLQGRAGLRHDVAPLTQPLDRIHSARRLTARLSKSLHAFHPQPAQFARGLFECGPVTLLFGGQQQAGLECRQPRFSERAHILNIRLPARNALRPTGTRLRVDEATADNGQRRRARKNRL